MCYKANSIIKFGPIACKKFIQPNLFKISNLAGKSHLLSTETTKKQTKNKKKSGGDKGGGDRRPCPFFIHAIFVRRPLRKWNNYIVFGEKKFAYCPANFANCVVYEFLKLKEFRSCDNVKERTKWARTTAVRNLHIFLSANLTYLMIVVDVGSCYKLVETLIIWFFAWSVTNSQHSNDLDFLTFY